ncbi:hypothetical protein CA85_47110 [Allorhodopirellula solitaria]|uniref:Lipoprotein n=1 Tax=Allorhodopirellula solitaria TaxID=2527987 RepID=A0A5C5WZZ1_9BACT|nr:hypothetical protein CA85_47110 [Allorhodopirellula solitaria]
MLRLWSMPIVCILVLISSHCFADETENIRITHEATKNALRYYQSPSDLAVIGTVFSENQQGERVEKGVFEITRKGTAELLFRYRNGFEIKIANRGRVCEYTNFRDVIRTDRSLERTLNAVAGITRLTSTLILEELFVDNADVFDRNADTIVLESVNYVNGVLCTRLGMKRGSGHVSYCIDNGSGAVLDIVYKSLLQGRERTTRYCMRYSKREED